MLVFDLDGTISDPIEGITRSINYALTHYGYEPRPVAELSRYIGPSLAGTFAELSGASDVRHLVDKYRERYSDTGYQENIIYAGIAETLSVLHEAGIPMAVCTSKCETYAVKIVEMFGISHMFGEICGVPAGELDIPKSLQLKGMLERGIIDASAIMIGDRDIDIIAAHANGLAACGVLWGYGSLAEFSPHNPRHVASAPADLLDLAGMAA